MSEGGSFVVSAGGNSSPERSPGHSPEVNRLMAALEFAIASLRERAVVAERRADAADVVQRGQVSKIAPVAANTGSTDPASPQAADGTPLLHDNIRGSRYYH